MAKDDEVPGRLPGMEEKRDPQIHKAAERLNSCLDDCGEANGKKKDAEAALIKVLLDKGWKPGQVYKHGKIRLKLNQKYSVNVKEVGEDDEEDEGHEE